MSANGISRRAMLGGMAALGIAAGPGKALATTHTFSPVQRDFSDPYLEQIRMLQETRDNARSIDRLLPGNFDLNIYDQLLSQV